MAFTGEREFIERHLDYLWELMEELVLEAEKAIPDQFQAINERHEQLKTEYDDYHQRLGALPPRW